MKEAMGWGLVAKEVGGRTQMQAWMLIIQMEFQGQVRELWGVEQSRKLQAQDRAHTTGRQTRLDNFPADTRGSGTHINPEVTRE